VTLAADAPPRPGADPIDIDVKDFVARNGAVPEAEASIRRMVEHTRATAPHLMKRIKALIVQHCHNHAIIQTQRAEVLENIRREETGDIVWKKDDRGRPLPPNFREQLSLVLPHVHRRVYVNLTDKDEICETLTEIFVEFLLRLGESFVKFERHHNTLLDELCDRHCAEVNGIPAVDFVPVPEAEMKADKSVPNIIKVRLVDDIYKNIFFRIAEMHADSKGKLPDASREPTVATA